MVFRPAVVTRGTSRRCGHVLLSGLGVLRSGWRPARTSGLSRTAARQRRPSRPSGTVDASGLFNAGATIRSSLSIARAVEFVSNGRLKSPRIGRGSGWRRHRAAWRLFRKVVASSHGQLGRAAFEHPGQQVGSRRTAGPFSCHGSGLATGRVPTRRLAGCSKVLAALERSCRRSSIRAAVQQRMEPTCPTVLCHHVATARGSFAAVGRHRAQLPLVEENDL